MPFNPGKLLATGVCIMPCFRNLLVPTMLLAMCVAAVAQSPSYGVGRPATQEEIQTLDVLVGPAGKELPPGKGTAKEGAKIFAQKCAGCHGATAEGGMAKR